MAKVLYSLACFSSALLLFVIQPMVGRMLLPSFGGAAAVWNTCLVFFQGMLFLSYLYADRLSRVGVTKAIPGMLAAPKFFHLLLVLGAWYWLASQNFLLTESSAKLSTSLSDPAWSPAWLVLKILVTEFGLPLLVLGASAPLLQQWFASMGQANPYWLYVASNLGSFAALALYPVVIERALDLGEQGQLYKLAFGFYFITIAVCALFAARRPVEPQLGSVEAAPTTKRIKLLWGYLAFLPSALLVAVTTHLTNDVAPVPLLWVVPLALYLLSYIIAFSGRLNFTVWEIPLRTLSLCGVILVLPHMFTPLPGGRWLGLFLHLLAFFLIGCNLHLHLYARRPELGTLTRFYLAVSMGGVLGGIVGGLLPPLLFSSAAEYPLLLLLYLVTVPVLSTVERGQQKRREGVLGVFFLGCLFLLLFASVTLGANFGVFLKSGAVGYFVYAVGGLVLVYLGKRRPVGIALGGVFVTAFAFISSFYDGGETLVQLRNFFGVKRVLIDRAANRTLLVHGRIVHGVQSRAPESRHQPLAYYAYAGPLGVAIQQLATRPLKIGVIGLGAGSVAAYAPRAEIIRFFELDPEVEALARDTRYFSFLEDCGSRCEVVLGDGRLQLQHQPDGYFDILILDAFSSDSVPVHLLSVEALQLYQQKLAESGVLLINASNKFLKIDTVVAAIAAKSKLLAFKRKDGALSPEDQGVGRFSATWVFIPKNSSVTPPPGFFPLTTPADESELSPWTDRYSNIFAVIKWR